MFHRPRFAAALFVAFWLVASAPARGEEEWTSGRGQSTSIESRRDDDPAVVERLRFYHEPPKEFGWRMRRKSEQERVRVWELEIESPVVTKVPENNWIRGFFYEPLSPVEGKRPGAVVLHHLGGEFTAEEMLGKMMGENGIATVFMYFPFYEKRWSGESRAPGIFTDDMEHSLGACRQAILDVHRVGDWLLQRPEVDPERLGLTGISLGAVMGSLAGGIDLRFAKLALVMAGGDLPEIVKKALEFKEVEKQLGAKGLTVEGLRSSLGPIEPLSFAHRVNPANVLLLNASDDEIIPKKCTHALWKKMGKPRIKWYKGGHYTISIYLTDVIQEVVRHLNGSVAPRTVRADSAAGEEEFSTGVDAPAK